MRMRWINRETARAFWKRWRALVIGGTLGLTYGVVSQQVDFEAAHAPKTFIWISDAVSVLLEGVLGALAGLAFNHIRSQARINRTLSTENANLQRHLLTQTLSAHILHEIRNPLHNVTAVLESGLQHLTPEDIAILERNLSRLQTFTNQLSRWSASDDELDLREPVLLSAWLEEFIADKVQPRLRQMNITLERQADSLVVHMHPMLLEQCFTPLINNALEAVLHEDGTRTIQLMARSSPDRPGSLEVHIRNTGNCYPEAVLLAQGKEPVESQHGLGLGLVLVHNSLALVGGSLHLSNTGGRADATLWIPGRPA